MRKMTWRCINCSSIFNPGPETIEEGEYFLIDMSKNFVCDECASEVFVTEA
jgi:DNA-directed RNA polymerase subunit RPC12/RpoP